VLLHVDSRAIRSCSVAAAMAIGKSVVTIEGVSPDGGHRSRWRKHSTRRNADIVSPA
jgi:aerobic-type carbon monoxide dehydrogenase small subunit (CoxS/CutS family)